MYSFFPVIHFFLLLLILLLFLFLYSFMLFVFQVVSSLPRPLPRTLPLPFLVFSIPVPSLLHAVLILSLASSSSFFPHAPPPFLLLRLHYLLPTLSLLCKFPYLSLATDMVFSFLQHFSLSVERRRERGEGRGEGRRTIVFPCSCHSLLATTHYQ